MAIDTNNKKFSVIGMTSPYIGSMPVSIGSIGQDDKQHLLWGYPGILWSSPAPTTAVCYNADVSSLSYGVELQGLIYGVEISFINYDIGIDSINYGVEVCH